MANIQLGSKAIMSVVKLNENGSPVEFYVAKHDYERGLNGAGRTLLVRKDCYNQRQWHSSNVNAYATSTIDTWLNDTYKNLLDANIRAAMGTTKFYYTPGNGNTIKTTLERSVFLLSAKELGKDSNSYINAEGTALEGANTLKFVYLDGSTVDQWTRSPYMSSKNTACILNRNSALSHYDCSRTYGSRPAFTLPSTLSVTDDGMVVTNAAPTTPPSMTLPEHINGGTAIPVSWGASTDEDGNLEGYVVERSVDGGDSWTQIYQGTATSTTNTVPFGTEAVMYRVRAYDSAGEYSPWRTSEQREVDNNTAPTAPAGITVPLTVLGGGEVTVTWSTAYDSEGNLSGYALERRVDGGEWAEIYRGTALSFTDAITKGWESVGYRVCAYDSCGAQSAYTEAPTRTVDNNTAPVITTDAGHDLGLVQNGFAVAYTVDDPDGDAVSVTETVDGETVRTFPAEPGQEYSFQLEGEAFQRVLNGSHTAAIVAGDGKAETVHALTFEKSVTACSVTMLEAMEADAEITVMVMAVSGFIPMDADFQVLVTNNANDSEPAWEDATAAVMGGINYVFENHEAENGFAFNFRVTAERGPSGVGGYISSIQGGFQ